MTNPFYTVTGLPTSSSKANSSTVRGEFAAIQAGFDALLTYTWTYTSLVITNNLSVGGVLTIATPATNINTTQAVNGSWVNTWYAPIASPTFTGVPSAPTPGSNISTTQIPTTAWVNAWYAPIVSPALTGTPTAPTPVSNISTAQIATTAWVNAYFASLASPAFSGVPTGPTAAPGTNTTQLATTSFVMTQAFSGALPAQAGNANKSIFTNGTTAAWGFEAITHVSGTTGTVTAGMTASIENVATTALTLAALADNDEFVVMVKNGLSTNTLDIGAYTLYGPVGSLTGVVTLDATPRVYRFKYSSATTSLEIL